MPELIFQAYNTTYSAWTTGLSSTTWTLLPIALILVFVLGIGLAFISYDWFKRYFKLIGFVGKSFIYFLKGLLVVLCGLAIYGLYWILSQLSEQGYVRPEYYLYAIVGYFSISTLGYIADKYWKRMKEHRKKIKREKS